MSRFIDRRLNGRHKNAVNRQRFMRRFKQQIQKAVQKAVGKRTIKEIDGKGENIHISSKDISEPNFGFGQGGVVDQILPGNQQFVEGDQIKRPDSSGGGTHQGEASDAGEGQDDFIFEISREEFLEVFFEDLALPNLVKTQISQEPIYEYSRAGFSTEGVPTNINVVRSMKEAMGRRIALTTPLKKKLKALEAALESLSEDNTSERLRLIEEIEGLKHRINAVPFLDPFDIRYHNRVSRPKPNSQAVMFCLMDVSGSMDEVKKDIAKRFFILLYLFLKRNYEKVTVEFIRHHTSAKRVDEEEFFYSRETGGTVVSSALQCMSDTVAQDYPTSDWNIYAAQASDGDNWNNDSPKCSEILHQSLLPFCQYFAYVEIMPRHHQSLWDAYQQLTAEHPHFAIQHIESAQDIYPVFRKLFQKNTAGGSQ